MKFKALTRFWITSILFLICSLYILTQVSSIFMFFVFCCIFVGIWFVVEIAMSQNNVIDEPLKPAKKTIKDLHMVTSTKKSRKKPKKNYAKKTKKLKEKSKSKKTK